MQEAARNDGNNCAADRPSRADVQNLSETATRPVQWPLSGSLELAFNTFVRVVKLYHQRDICCQESRLRAQ